MTTPDDLLPDRFVDDARDLLADVQPDLHSVLAGATARGRRTRRVRRAGAGLAAAAIVAGVGVGTAAIAGHNTGHASDYAAGPSAAPMTSAAPAPSAAPTLHEGQVLHVTAKIDGLVVRNGHLPKGAVPVAGMDAPSKLAEVRGISLGAARRMEPFHGYTVVLSGPYDAVQRYWSNGFVSLFHGYPGVEIATSAADTAQPLDAGHEVNIGLSGWSCGTPGDNKTSCTGPHGQSVGLTWYQGNHDQFAGEYGPVIDTISALGGMAAVYRDSSGTYYAITAPTSDGTFINIGYTPGASEATVKQVAESLSWK